MLKLLSGALGSALLVGATLSAQRDFSKVTVEIKPVAGNVHVLYGRGGNLGVCVSEDELLVVDSQFAGLAPKIQAALKELHDAPIRYLLNTHWHGDHTGGNVNLGADSVRLAHRNVRRRLAADESIDGRKAEDGDPRGFPVITFDESVQVHFPGEEIELIHLWPGHTDGDSVVHFETSGVAHLGDLYFRAGFPFVDFDSGGSLVGLTKAIDHLLEILPAGTRVIPGHGEATDLAGLREYRDMLHGTRKLVRDAREKGQSDEEIAASDLLAPYAERWGQGFIKPDRFLGFLLREDSRD